MITDGKEVVKKNKEDFLSCWSKKGKKEGKEQGAWSQRVADMRSLISVMQVQISSSVPEESNKMKMVMVHFWLSKVGVVGDPLLKSSMWSSSCTTTVAKATWRFMSKLGRHETSFGFKQNTLVLVCVFSFHFKMWELGPEDDLGEVQYMDATWQNPSKQKYI